MLTTVNRWEIWETWKNSEARTFLRLYDIGSANDCGEDDTADDRNVRALKQYLCRGEIESQIYYLTSLGSLQIMQKIKDKAATADEPLQPEASPEGHLGEELWSTFDTSSRRLGRDCKRIQSVYLGQRVVLY